MSVSISECRLYKILPSKNNSPPKRDQDVGKTKYSQPSMRECEQSICNENNMENVFFSPKCKNVEQLKEHDSTLSETKNRSLLRKNSYRSPTNSTYITSSTNTPQKVRETQNISSLPANVEYSSQSSETNSLESIPYKISPNELIAERRSKSTVNSDHIDVSIDSLLTTVNNAMKSINM